MHQNRSFEHEHTNSPVTVLLDRAVKFLILSSDRSSFFVNIVTRSWSRVFLTTHAVNIRAKCAPRSGGSSRADPRRSSMLPAELPGRPPPSERSDPRTVRPENSLPSRRPSRLGSHRQGVAAGVHGPDRTRRPGTLRRVHGHVGVEVSRHHPDVGIDVGGVRAVPGLRGRSPTSDLLHERDRVVEREVPSGGARLRALPQRASRAESLYLAIRALDPSGPGRQRWAMRWKPLPTPSRYCSKAASSPVRILLGRRQLDLNQHPYSLTIDCLPAGSPNIICPSRGRRRADQRIVMTSSGSRRGCSGPRRSPSC